MKEKSKIFKINAKGLHYKDLNEKIHQAVNNGVKEIILNNVNGQRYIGGGLSGKNINITVNGVPGNDLAAFMDGPTIIVNSNAQDGIGNTMNAGKIIIHGSVGDIAGHSMRGGCIYIKGNAGYRIGIHMKSYKQLHPVIIIGGTAGDFLGEYMAGGLIVVLGLNKKKDEDIVGNYCGTGMHGGTMYIHGHIKDYQLGKEVKKVQMNEEDNKILRKYLKEYGAYFQMSFKQIKEENFIKLTPSTHRPYGKLYAY
jgi:glutamate synthase domain-containing protein 3